MHTPSYLIDILHTYEHSTRNTAMDQLKQELRAGTTAPLLLSSIQTLSDNEIDTEFFDWLIPNLPIFYPNYHAHKLVLQLLSSNNRNSSELFTKEHLQEALDLSLCEETILYLIAGLEFEAVDKKMIQLAKEKNYHTSVIEAMLLSIQTSAIDEDIIYLAIEKKCSSSVFTMLTWHLTPGQLITKTLIQAAQAAQLSDTTIQLLTACSSSDF